MNAVGSYNGAPRPARKSTYTVRKEEKQQLLEELEVLQAKLKVLDGVERENLVQRQLETSVLRGAVQQQQLSLVDTQSAISAYVSTVGGLPFETSIHLGSEFTQRRDVLMATKESMLLASLAYSTARARFLDPFRSFSEISRYSLDSGDYHSLRLDQTPLFQPQLTVREVVDAIMESNSSIDMRVTDLFGDITTCDDMHYGVSGVWQSRFAARLTCGVDAEMNIVNFHHYFEHMDDEYGGGPVGVFASDFVDQDDLYPYHTSGRVRFDMTGVLVVRKRKGMRHNPVTGKEEETSVIVLTQSSLYKFRRPQVPLLPDVEDQLHEQLGHWGRALVSSVVDKARRRNGNKPTSF